jgi:hypothetical protein
MLLNPSPCQIVDAAQHDGVIRERTFAALARFQGGSE